MFLLKMGPRLQLDLLCFSRSIDNGVGMYIQHIKLFSINLLVVYRESVNLTGYLTRRLSADSLQL